jgi:hypothetical protein
MDLLRRLVKNWVPAATAISSRMLVIFKQYLYSFFPK